MRVLVGGFSGHLCGGIETFLLNMNDKMSSDCVFDYIISGDKCIHSERIARKGGRVYFTSAVRKNPFGYIADSLKILKKQRETTDIFYYNMHSAANFIPPVLARLCGYKVILHSHNNGLQNAGKLYYLVHSVGKLLLGGRKYIRWTNSEKSSEFMFGKEKKSELIYNGIDVKRFKYNESVRYDIRKDMGDEDNVVYGFAGRLEYPKNPEFLIEIFAELKKHISNAVLWVLGEGSLLETVKNRVSEQGLSECVRFIGFKENLNEYFSAMDVFLLPSRFEGLGIVLVEAQASGLSCITSKNVPDIVDIDGNVLFLPLDVGAAAWAEKITETDIDIKRRSEAYKKVEASMFNIDSEALRIEKLLKSF